MNTYITGCIDTEKFLILYTDLHEICIIAQLNSSINKLLRTYPFYPQLLIAIKNNLVISMCTNNFTELFNKIYQIGYRIKIKDMPIAIYYAAMNNHASMLNLFKEKFNYTFNSDKIIYGCIINGHINMLEWFSNNFNITFEYRYTIKCIRYAARNNHFNILDWYINKKIINKVFCHDRTEEIIHNKIIQACLTNDVHFLDLVYNYNKSYFDYDSIIYYINAACKKGLINILEWFIDRSIPFNYSSESVGVASKYNQFKVVKWFVMKNYRISDTKIIIHEACRWGNYKILSMLKNHKYNFVYTDVAICLAAKYGRINILEWFYRSGFEFKYCSNARKWTDYKYILEWFDEHNFL